MAAAWKIDRTNWPLVVLYVGEADIPAISEIESLLRHLDALIAKRERVAVLADLTGASPDASGRRRYIEWVKAHSASVRTQTVAFAPVATSALQRGVITGVLWFLTPLCPMKVFGDRDAAVSWARGELARAGL